MKKIVLVILLPLLFSCHKGMTKIHYSKNIQRFPPCGRCGKSCWLNFRTLLKIQHFQKNINKSNISTFETSEHRHPSSRSSFTSAETWELRRKVDPRRVFCVTFRAFAVCALGMFRECVWAETFWADGAK